MEQSQEHVLLIKLQRIAKKELYINNKSDKEKRKWNARNVKERDTKYFENYVRWSVATSPHINVSSVLEILLVARHSYSLHTGLHPYSHVRPTSSQPFESVAGMHVETSETTPRTCFPLAFRRFFISSTVNLSVPLSF